MGQMIGRQFGRWMREAGCRKPASIIISNNITTKWLNPSAETLQVYFIRVFVSFRAIAKQRWCVCVCVYFPLLFVRVPPQGLSGQLSRTADFTLPVCVCACLFCPLVCQLWHLALSLEGDFTVCLTACLFSWLSVSPLGLGSKLTRVADVPLSRWWAGVKVFLGRQRCGVGHHRTWHLGHQGLQNINNEFLKIPM